MKIKRRELLGVAAVVAAGSLSSTISSAAARPAAKRILVLGGSGFIGPHFVRAAQARGHHITLFNRGRTNKDMFPEATKLIGDRDNGLDALTTGEWDVVLDNSGYVPRHVMDSATLLKGRVGRYIFTSSVAAYDVAPDRLPMGATSKLATLAEPTSENVGKYYGPLKAVAEGYVSDIYGDNSTIVRPTYVAGPGDGTQRFTWWVDRIHRGGEILAPGTPETSYSLIDVRDLAEFYLTLAENDTAGIFNASGPNGLFNWGGLLHGIRATTTSEVRFCWADSQFLLSQKVNGGELPMWNAGSDSIHGQLWENKTSVDAGLRYRSLATTAIDTLTWYRALTPEQQKFSRAGIDAAKEQAVLAALKQRG
jgi:2'-hydroxyisoflavone reductase